MAFSGPGLGELFPRGGDFCYFFVFDCGGFPSPECECTIFRVPIPSFSELFTPFDFVLGGGDDGKLGVDQKHVFAEVADHVSSCW